MKTEETSQHTSEIAIDNMKVTRVIDVRWSGETILQENETWVIRVAGEYIRLSTSQIDGLRAILNQMGAGE